MDFKVVEEGGVKQLDTSLAQKNFDEHSEDVRGLARALTRAQFERGNAERILRVMKKLSDCWINHNKPERYFFFTKWWEPALLKELAPKEFIPGVVGIWAISLSDVKRVKCPGCMEMRPLIGYYVPGQFRKEPGELVICGNSLHIIKSHV